MDRGLDRDRLDRVLAGGDPFDETTMLDDDEPSAADEEEQDRELVRT